MDIYKYVHFTREQLETEFGTSCKSGLSPNQVLSLKNNLAPIRSAARVQPGSLF